MLIQLKKFGTLLNSRQAGKEALAAFEPSADTADSLFAIASFLLQKTKYPAARKP